MPIHPTKSPVGGLPRRLGALALGCGVLYLTAVTAGAQSFGAAAASLRAAAPLAAVRWELGELWVRDDLEGATVLALSQSPLLMAARDEVAALRRQGEETPETQAPPPPTAVEEAPVEVEAAPSNGVAARTLVPASPEGYFVSGRTYITNTSGHDLTAEDVAAPFAAALGTGDPQVLILHTHGSEAYTPPPETAVVWSGDHRTTDSRYNVLAAGDAMAEVFGAAGISVLHDRTLYDYPSYSGAYDRSLAAIQRYLAQYPSIRFVLDVHRDAVEDGAGNQFKVVAETAAGLSAQLSIVVGSDGGGLSHPAWRENLRLGAAIQDHLLAENPQLCRPLLLRSTRYNQHVTPGSLLVEVGAAGNDPAEAVLAARLFAQGMVDILTQGAAAPQPMEADV